MRQGDGNISPWVEELDASVNRLSAKDIGFKLPPRWHIRFERSLRENPDASRLLRDVLPKCEEARLARYATLIVSTPVEQHLLELTRKRGEDLKKIIRLAARKDKGIQSRAREVISRADRAFDTRRQGLAQYCFPTLIMRRYLRFRSGLKPTARELATLLVAGLAASGRLQAIDHDLLGRNLKNYEEKHPHPLATGERCAEIIELNAPATP